MEEYSTCITTVETAYVSVILDISVQKSLEYSVPAELCSQVKRGVQVEVPVRGHLRKGYVLEVKEKPDFARVLPIARVVSEGELIPPDLFELALWMAKFYCTPINLVLRTMLPASIRKKEMQPKQQLYVMRSKTRDELSALCVDLRGKSPGQTAVLDVMLQVKGGILLSELLEKTKGSRSPVDTLVKKGALEVDIVRVDRSPLMNEEYLRTKPKVLNEFQKTALDKILDALEQTRFETHLLYGVTGSGKTEVYLQAITKALQLGKGVIMLVPEIALTPQTIERFRSRFEGNIAVLHHQLSDGERTDEWNRIKSGRAQIVIGARSAVFSPVPNLGLIIVDEEHESSYKQTEEMPAYHAREIAVMRGKMSNSTVILGSATPSMESYQNAKTGKYHLSKLTLRADGAGLPHVTIVDMKPQYAKARGFTNFSEQLLDGIKKRQELGEQTILFLNRRGYHTSLLCQKCQQSLRCKHCEVSLTFHMGENSLACHLCGYSVTPPPSQCSLCGNQGMMKFKGVGTELVEKSLHAIFPDIRTIRMDADTTRHKGSHQKFLRDFGSGKADVLIGTQMIAKGLHFPQVTLVGVLNCDGPLQIPDFRASENVFQLITQVAGRSGRGNTAGEVILQTCLPDNSTIGLAARQDYEAFFEEEIALRNLFRFPPAISMVKLLFSGINMSQTNETAMHFRQNVVKALPPDFEIHPVLPGGYAKIKDKFRFQFLIRGPSILPISRVVEDIKNTHAIPNGVKLYVDVNPLSTFF